MRYTIQITFETDEKIPDEALEDVAGAAFVQLEALSEDHGVAYHRAEVQTLLGDGAK